MKTFNKLSIIIPCFNEERYVEKLINDIFEIVNPHEVIIVDDCSTDNSVNIIKNLKHDKVILIKHDENKGKGVCIVEGIKNSTGDIAIIQDADPEYSPKDIEMLTEPFEEFETTLVIGTRFQTSYRRKIGYFYHTFFNKMITFLVNLKSNTNFTDIECGYKAIRIETIKNIELKEKRFGIEVELIRKISKLKKNMYEVPVSYEMRGYKEGKKIGISDALSALYCLLKY